MSNPEKHRRSIRLPGYDYYQPGAYFVTIVTQDRRCIFGDIVAGEMKLSRFGTIVEQSWLDLPCHYPHVELGAFCIMPNHVHGVIIIHEETNTIVGAGVGAGLRPAPTGPFPDGEPLKRPPLSEIVRAFKSFSARRINEIRNTRGEPLWQRNYYEHIIRDDAENRQIFDYITANPSAWPDDQENPSRIEDHP